MKQCRKLGKRINKSNGGIGISGAAGGGGGRRGSLLGGGGGGNLMGESLDSADEDDLVMFLNKWGGYFGRLILLLEKCLNISRG